MAWQPKEGRFEIVSGFTPQGDQPEAIEKLARGIQEGKRYQTLLGVTGSGKTFTMANVIERVNRPALVIAPNKTLAAQLYNEFKELFPNNAVRYFVSYYDYYQPEAYVPSTDTYIEKDASINDEIDKLRHSATKALLERRDTIIVASVSCIYGIGSPEAYHGMLVMIEEGQEFPRDAMLARLIEIQYKRNDVDFHRGTFRVRGDVVEIFPPYEEERAIRVEYFGDTIEAISVVDPLRGKKIEKLRRTAIYPGSHYVTSRENLKRAIDEIRTDLGERLRELKAQNKLLEAQRLEQRTNFDIEMLEEMGYCSGIENYSRHLTGRRPGEPPPTLMEYLPPDALIFIDESHATVPQLRAMAHGDRSRKTSLVEHGFRLPSAFDNRPLNFEEFEGRRAQTVFVSATPAPYELERAAGRVAELIARPTGLMEPVVEVRPVAGQVEDLLGEIRARAARGERVLVTALTKRMAEDLTEHFAERGLRVRYLHSDVETLERLRLLRDLRLGAFDALIGINLLREGLDLPEVSLVAILDADKEGFLRSETSLIQTAGRAARNLEGRVILYADTMTGSMRRALAEMARRRAIQEEHNRREGIRPVGISKAVTDVLAGIAEPVAAAPLAAEALESYRSLDDLERVVRELETQMREAAGRLDFERAAALRDRIRGLKGLELAVGVGAGEEPAPAGRRRGGRAAGAPGGRRRGGGRG
jgi:excinuclease ABC subunit B